MRTTLGAPPADCRCACLSREHNDAVNCLDFWPSRDTITAQAMISSAANKGEVLTGLLFLSPDAEDLHAHLNTFEAPFNKLGEKDLCPGAGMLEKINAGLR